MTHEELQGEYELYALGVAEEPARGEIRAHLDRKCEVCMAEMKRAKQIAAMIGASAAPQAPSPKLRKRILASAGYEPRSYGLAPWLGALAGQKLSASPIRWMRSDGSLMSRLQISAASSSSR